MIRSLAFLAGLAISGVAHAQFAWSFESNAYVGSPAGTIAAGQGCWYTPNPPAWPAATNSADAFLMTYAGNVPGFNPNPQGGDQFILTRWENRLVGVTATAFQSRAQHPVDLERANVWKFSYDIAVIRTGTLPATNNIGSFSVQPSVGQLPAQFPSGTQGYQSLFIWSDLNTGANWNHQLGVAQASPTALNFLTPADPAFSNLDLNTWYRFTQTVDFTQHRITEISVDNLSDANPPVVVDTSAEPYFLLGGAASTLPKPNAIRLFGSGALGNPLAVPPTEDDVNLVAWDNVRVDAVPAICRADLTDTAVQGSPGYGIPNGTVNSEDFFYYLAQYGAANLAVADLTTGATPGQSGYGVPNCALNSEDFFFYLTLYSTPCAP